MLLAFSAGGIAFHEVDGSVLAELARISSPFLFGFFPVGFVFGSFERPDSGKVFAGRSAATLLLGMSCGFVLRGIQRGAFPTAPFIGIALTFCAVLTLVWRGLYWKFSTSSPRGC